MAQSMDAVPNNAEAIVRAYYPNLATISPDGPGVVASMSGFLGLPTTGLEHSARDGRWIDREQYSSAFRGKFDYMGQIILGLVFDTREPLLSENDGLPITVSNTLKITWDEVRFAEGMWEREPEEGTARVMLSSSEQREGHLLRRAKAIQVEHGHLGTPEGQAKLILQMQQVQKALHITFSFDALVTMLQERARDVSWRMAHWFNDLIDEQVLNLYTNAFIGWQKNSDGAKKTVTTANDIHEMKNGFAPSMMYAPRGIENLIKGAENSDQLSYEKVGVLAEQRRNVDASKIASFRGLRLHLTRKYDGFQVGQVPIEPMVDPRMFGEFYQFAPMRPTHPYYKLEANNNQIPPYKTSNRDIQPMDLSADKFGKLTLEEAVNKANCYEGDTPDSFVRGCGGLSFGAPPPQHHSRTFVESPFETVTLQGVRKIVCFGEMEHNFLSDAAVDLMISQVKANASATADVYANSYTLRNSGVNQGLVASDVTTRGLEVGTKRAREEEGETVSSSPVVYATLTTTAGTTAVEPENKSRAVAVTRTLGLVDMEKYNNEKLASRDAIAAKQLYGMTTAKGADKLDEQTKFAIAQRTYGILASGNDSMIKDELVTPLVEASKLTGGLSEERKLQKDNLIARLAQPSEAVVATAGLVEPTAATNVAPETKTGFFTLRDVQGASKVEYLDPATGNVVQDQTPFQLDSVAGFVKQQLVLSRGGVAGGVSTRTGELTERSIIARSAHLTDFWVAVDTQLGKVKKTQVPAFVKRLNSFASRFPADLDLVFALLTQKVNRQFFNILIGNNIFFPFIVLVPRPWVCVTTCCVIIGTGGRALGATYIKDPDVMKGDDATSKIHEWHVNIWNKALIHKPNLITVWDDVAMRSYKGGGSLKYVTRGDKDRMSQNQWRIPRNDRRGSIFSVLCGYDESKQIPEVINFKTKRMLNPEFDKKDTPPVICVEDNEFFSSYLNQSPADSHVMQTWVQQQSNSLCFQATQLLYNPYKGNFSCVIFSNNNHLGPNMYSGMMHDLRSMNTILKDQGYNNPALYTHWFSM